MLQQLIIPTSLSETARLLIYKSMWKRIVWDIIVIALVFIAPWWVTLLFGIIGAALFPWYLEIIFFGVLYDVLFGGVNGSWYYHLIHTGIFTTPLLVAELIKTKINTR